MESNDRLTEKDQKILDKIYNYSTEVCQVYYQLFLEELDDKGKQSVQYQTLLQRLRNAICLENRAYEQWNLSDQKALRVYDQIGEDERNYLVAALNPFSPEAFVNMRLSARLLKRCKPLITLMNQSDFESFLEPMEERVKDSEMIRDVISHVKLMDSIHYDLNKAFLYFNEEQIRSFQQNPFFKSELIRAKYITSISCPEIEKEFLENAFTVDDNLLMISDIAAEQLGVDEERLRCLRNDVAVDFLNPLILDLDVSEKKRRDPGVQFRMLLKASYLRAGMLLYRDPKVAINMIDTLKDVRYYGDEEEHSFEFLIEQFKKSLTDLPKCKYLSMHRKSGK